MNERLAIDSLGIHADDPGVFDGVELRLAPQRAPDPARPTIPDPVVSLGKTMMEKFKEHMTQDWRHEAACAGDKVDPELFFPIGERGAGNETQIAEAKKICMDCDVRRECLTTALEGKEQGIWGGTTDGEREALRRRVKRSVR